MKIRHKVITLAMVLGLLLLVFGSLALIQQSFILYVVTTIVLCSVVTILSYNFFVKRVEKLNKDIMNVQLGASKTQKIPVEGYDEFSEIASRFNVLLDTLALSRQQLFLLSEHKGPDAVPLIPEVKKVDLKNLDSQVEEGLPLPGRLFFNDALNKAISFAKRHGRTAAALIVNIELLNTGLASDTRLDAKLVKEIAKLFTTVLRSEDVLAKLDGNEFVVLLHDVGKPKFVSAIAEKLLKAISPGVYVGDTEFLLRAAIGICICPNDATTLEEAIEKIYCALYKAKAQPENNYQFYTKELDLEAREYLHIKSELKKAIQNNELVLHYQPKLDIKKGVVVGVEVLIRWSHPVLGLLTPGKFLDVAEDSGCIIAMGEWAMREACKANMHWQQEGYEHLTVALNVSTKQFYHTDLLRSVTSILNDTKLNANYLELEVNEETIISDLEKAETIMQSLAALGVKISIDHFGKGYTSMSHLKHLPVSAIKIDRGFITGVPQNPNDSAITSAIIALAHFLGIYALAEGVENADQLRFLSQQNCDMVQGYFLSYPLPMETVTQHFKKISDRAIG